MEFFVPDSSVLVRQGDVLICRDPKSIQIEQICIVITADCDISKRKFGDQLACLRVIELDSYIRNVWAGRKLEKLRRDEEGKLRDQVAKWHTRSLGSESRLSVDAAVGWVRREDPVMMCQTLEIPEDDRKKFIAALTTFRSAFSTLDRKDQRDALSQYAEFRAAIGGKDLQTCRSEVLQQAKKEPLPEDVFLVTELPQMQAESAPAVILLREVVGIPYDMICYRATDAVTNKHFIRAGRLQPTFKYAVSQSFGALYSRIGLPDEYEDRRRSVIQNIDNYSWA